MSFFVEFIIFYRYPERNTSLSGNLVRSAIAVASRKDETEDYNMVTLEQVRRSLETEMKNENVSKKRESRSKCSCLLYKIFEILFRKVTEKFYADFF